MKLTAFFLAAFFLQVHATGFSQSVTLTGKEMPLKQAFGAIEKQTGFVVFYNEKLLADTRPVTFSVRDMKLADFLDLVLKDQPLRYVFEDKNIILIKKSPISAKSHLPGNLSDTIPKNVYPLMDVKGRVTDESGRPLAGATVTLWSSDIAAVTDADGYFRLRMEVGSRVLVTSVGYKRLAISIRTLQPAITLVQDFANLDNVQIIGYGSATKRLNTATVSSITSEEIKQQPVTNVLTSLNGRMTGVQVVQANGMAGSAVSIKVRGDNTMGISGSTSSDPLYVVDGIPQASGNRYDVQNFYSNIRGMNGYTNIFDILNKEDIERMDVLKDADATAIYGARGANGVVLITTKKGREGKVKVNVNLTSGAGKVGRFIPMLNTSQYLDLRKEAFRNENIIPNANNAPDLVSWDQNAYTDFQNVLLGGAAKIRTADVSASGGSEYVNYYVGLNYRKEGTVIASDQFVNRAGGLMNLNVTSRNRKFKAFVSANYAEENSNMNASNFMSLIGLPPNFNLHKDDGSLNWNNNFDNPLAYLLTTYEATKMLLSANTSLTYKLLPGLTLKTTAGYSSNRLDNNFQMPSSRNNPARPRASWAWFAESPTTNYIIEPQAEYIVNAGGGRFTVLAGGTFSQALSETTTLMGDNYSNDGQLNTIAGAGIVNTSYQYDQYRYSSIFGRLGYDIHSKYLLNVTYRRDASSRFGPANRFANFGSAGAAWLFSEEKLFKNNLPFLSFGKLKMSYGTTGNDRIDSYLYLMSYSGGPIYQDIRVLDPVDQAANPSIKWESTKKAEISLSLGFLKDRILFNANIYRNRSSDLLNYTSITTQSGVTTNVENLDALVQNRGVELELNSRNITGKAFSWSTGFNISFERNKLVAFNDKSKSFNQNRYYIGQDVNAYITRRKFQYAGVDPVKGIPTYTDLDGSPGLGTKDRYIAPLGHPFYGGLSNSITYKEFTLDFFFKFENRMGQVNPYGNVNSIAPGGLMNQTTSVLDRWRNSGDVGTRWPLAVTGTGIFSSSYSSLASSDFTYGNVSYIKLKTAALSYHLPQAWAHKAKMQQVTVSLQGLNLFTIAKNKYTLDPEYEGISYPGLRTVVFALNCSL